MTTAPRSHSRLVLLIGALVALLAIAPACEIDDDGTTDTTTNTRDTSTNTSNNPMSATVGFDGSSMSPAIVTIAPGGTVTFDNNSDAEMVIDFSDADTSLDSGTIVQGGSFQATLNAPGDFSYVELNSAAAGRVIVE